MGQRILQAIALVLAALVIGLALFWQPEPPARAVPKLAENGGDFTLQAANGPVSLKDFRGKLLLLYFGYTYCPDICPTSLAATAEGLKQLSPQERARVAMLFVSVDPERDTPQRLQEYAGFFHPNIVGATGSPAVIADIARRYGAFYARQQVDTAGGYVVDHTADTYVIGPAGELLGRIPHAAPPEQVLAAIRQGLR